MTLKEFLAALPRDGWRIELSDELHRCLIRRGDDECPVSSLDGRPASDWLLVAKRRRLSRTLAESLTLAADESTGHCRALRGDLLKACGLA